MAKRQVSTSAQRGLRPSPSHRISTSCLKASDGSSLTLCVEKQTTTPKPGEVRRSSRLKAVLQLEGSSKEKQPELGLSSAGEASRDQVVGISLALLAIC